MKKDVILVIASQDYNYANHRYFWDCLSAHTTVIVANISADCIVSVIRGKTERLREAKQPPTKINDSLYVFRPLFVIRPELMPAVFHGKIGKILLSQVNRKFGINTNNSKIHILAYDGMWIDCLKKCGLDLNYYLFDEVRQNAHTGRTNQKQKKDDDIACRYANRIFAMSKCLKDNRPEYSDKIIVFGNGAIKEKNIPGSDSKRAGVAFIGNFRDWIDKDLLSQLIKMRQDIKFNFVGNVEADMQEYCNELSLLDNVYIKGKLPKDKVSEEYKKYHCVLIPYRQNQFMYATRPIKIVESIFAGTPVVTIPVSGYEECRFIRFARTAEEFSDRMDEFIKNPIDTESEEYTSFVDENSWESKAKAMCKAMIL